ncbi:MAG TPA: sulfotransferase family 2 domain-containing protein [Vicinamibacterales bacterium]|nr:sulfotransferase family 2 domain-containing protein [Vicinamibacterales bacterium]
MAIVSRPHNLLFLMAPRTGCTAVGRVLTTSLSGEFIPPEDLLDDQGFFVVQRKHSTLAQLLAHGVLTNDERRSLFAFTAIRNPFDSLLSLYTKKSTKYQPHVNRPDSWVHKAKGYVEDMEYCRTHDFNQWIAARFEPGRLDRLRRRGRRGLYADWVEGVDFVMRFERLQEDFNEVLRRAGVDASLQIPTINVTSRERDYRPYYSRASRRTVEYAFADELARFNYRF